MLEAQLLREQGYKQWEIAERLGVSERTVRTYLKSAVSPRKQPERKSKLDPHRDLITSVLEKQPYYNLVLLVKRLRKAGYTGKMTILREYAARLRKKITTEAIIRFETEPGFQAQVDWKELGKRTIDGRQVKLYAFVMILGFSRKPFVYFTTSMRSAVLLYCMKRAIQYFGGVPAEVLFDNMKTAFVADSDGVFHPNLKLMTFATHYGFTPRRCRVRRPQTKGKVERLIGYLAGNFLPTVCEADLSLDRLNEQVRVWLAEIGEAELRDFAESREERFAREREHLQTLPLHPADTRETVEVRVNRESLYSYCGVRYSAPAHLIGETLLVKREPVREEAELYNGRILLRSFTLAAPDTRNAVWWPEDKQSLQKRWEAEQHRTLIRAERLKAKHRDPEVDIRSPAVYELLTGEAAG